MSSINKIFICGNATRDAEVRTLTDGVTKVANFTIATSEGGYKRQDGTDVPEITQFHRVVAFRGLAQLAEAAIKKGVMVVVEGKMTYRTWFDDAVNKTGRHDTAEIVADNIKTSRAADAADAVVAAPVAEAAPQPEDRLPF